MLRCWVFKEWAGKLLLGVCQDPAFLKVQPGGSLRCLTHCAPWHFLLARTPVCVLSAPDSSSLTLLPGSWLPKGNGWEIHLLYSFYHILLAICVVSRATLPTKEVSISQHSHKVLNRSVHMFIGEKSQGEKEGKCRLPFSFPLCVLVLTWGLITTSFNIAWIIQTIFQNW